jgi:outer membrane protein TolC
MKVERVVLALAVMGLWWVAPATLWAQEAETETRPILELTLDDAVQRALNNNADIAVEKYNPEDSAQAVRGFEGFYDPLLSSTLLTRSQVDPARNAFTGGEKVDTDTWTYDFGLSQNLKTGGNLRLDFQNLKSDTNNVFASFNPAYDSTLTASLSQPLLRNFRIDRNRQELTVAKRNREISDVQFRQTVINTVAGVKQRYYDLIFSLDNLEAQRKSLALAKKLLDENQIKVRVGTMAPLDVVAAESEVASREEGVITAEAAVADAEDAVKQAIFPANDPNVWKLQVVPKDRPSAEPVAVDIEKAIRNALAQRTDVVAARKDLENSETRIRFAKNQTLPALDLIASYGAAGVGGTELIREGLGGPVVQTIPGGYGDATSAVFGRDFPTWSLGVSVSYPLFNRQAGASAARARIARDQAQASLRRLELSVAADVRAAGRAVETNFKRVASTRAARVLQERRLDAEEKRFAAGMSTNFLVTQAQRDLALAEVNELRATADFRKSVVDFERVQEAGGGVSFATPSSTVFGATGTGASTSGTGTGGTSTSGGSTNGQGQ